MLFCQAAQLLGVDADKFKFADAELPTLIYIDNQIDRGLVRPDSVSGIGVTFTYPFAP